MQRDWRTFLDDIVEACDKVTRYTAAMTPEAFQADEKTVDAVVRNLEVIPQAVRDELPDVDWQRIAGLRDVLIHQYFGIDLDIVWDVVNAKVPVLRERVFEFLNRLGDSYA